MTISFRRVLLSRLIIWLALAGFGGYFLYYIQHYVNFGIDLVGGTYITLEVQLDKAIQSEISDVLRDAPSKLASEGLPLPSNSQLSDDNKAIFTFADVDQAQSVMDTLLKAFPRMSSKQEGAKIILYFSASGVRQLKQEAVESNIFALSNRIDQFGVGETLVAKQGDSRIIIELPNVHDIQQAKSIIGRAALLEMKIVQDHANSRQELLAGYGGRVPEGLEVLPGKPMDGKSQHYLVSRFAELTGKQLKTASLGYGGTMGNEPVVQFQWKPAGAEKFYELTRNNIGRPLAIVIDDYVISAPHISTAIRGEGSISGNFSAEEARDLALLLRSGAFVAPVKFEEERHIGPSLGQESINKGLMACVIGLALLFVFSIVVYKVAGLLAFIVLLYNLLFILFALWALGATLTLPGIAGMILTVGMAIDASILIYERIREELALGAGLRHAVETGFDGAMSVILDANITHFLIASVLYFLGTGPIKGFAVTMIVGIVATLITGLWMLRSFFTYIIDVLGINKVKI